MAMPSRMVECLHTFSDMFYRSGFKTHSALTASWLVRCETERPELAYCLIPTVFDDGTHPIKLRMIVSTPWGSKDGKAVQQERWEFYPGRSDRC